MPYENQSLCIRLGTQRVPKVGTHITVRQSEQKVVSLRTNDSSAGDHIGMTTVGTRKPESEFCYLYALVSYTR